MIDFQKVKNLINELNNIPSALDSFWDKRDELVKLLGKNEEETLQFIENHIDKFTPKELEEFVDNMEDIFFKFYTKTFAQRMRKVANRMKYEFLDKEVEKMEWRTE
jgi:hypothetical protein